MSALKSGLIRLLHWIIILNFALQIGYSGHKTLSFNPEGETKVLFGAAKELPFEMMVTRRLYAIETWIAITGLSLYLALTVFLPYWRKQEEGRDASGT